MLLAKRLSSPEMGSTSQIQILEETVCISIWTNALAKSINPSLLHPQPPQQCINNRAD